MLKKIFNYSREQLYQRWARIRLKNKNFSIISDDCWGGRVYTDVGVSYTSPTVNLFFYSSCFLKLVQDLKNYIDKDLEFVTVSKYEIANQSRMNSGKNYPIGTLGDIEVHFLHSKDNEDALTKWNYRKTRLHYDNLFFKFSDAYLIDPNDLIEFEKLPLKNKVIFVSKKYDGLANSIHLKEFEKNGFVGDAFKYRWIYRKYFNAVKWLNNGK